MSTKTRNSAQGYWLYGVHSSLGALANKARKVQRIVHTRNAGEKLTGQIDAARHPNPEIMDPQAIDKLLPPGATHQGLAVLVSPLEDVSLEDVIESGKPLIMLDQVTDPHNVGAILRSAAAFDAGAVIVTSHHAPGETATMAKSASGAMDVVPLVIAGNLAQAMEKLKKAGYWCIGLEGEAKQTIAEAKLGRKSALILGAEGKGLRRLTAENCDLLVRLPIAPQMESLNVSNAAAIALYEIFRGDK